MHGHESSGDLVILKTKLGYLTSSGFTENINDHNIVIKRLSSLGGKWAPFEIKVKRMLDGLEIDYKNLENVEILAFSCSQESKCSSPCSKENKNCSFWTNRPNAKFYGFR